MLYCHLRLIFELIFNELLFSQEHKTQLTPSQARTPLTFQDASLMFHGRPSSVLALDEKSIEARLSDTFLASLGGGSALPGDPSSPFP
jgi:hypothetical protein